MKARYVWGVVTPKGVLLIYTMSKVAEYAYNKFMVGKKYNWLLHYYKLGYRTKRLRITEGSWNLH